MSLDSFKNPWVLSPVGFLSEFVQKLQLFEGALIFGGGKLPGRESAP
jgi:hypothetical protein